MIFNVKIEGLDKLKKNLDTIAKRQLPFAIAKALTKTAWDVQKEETKQLPQKLDRPTPFTMKAFGVIGATKRNLVATIYVKPMQAEYLKFQIEGGIRLPKRKALAIPVQEYLKNKYGNIPRGKIQTLLRQPNTFSGKVSGIAGIWQRGHYSKKGKWSIASKKRGAALKLLFAYEPRALYKKRFPFFEIAKGIVTSKFNKNFNEAFEEALRTAR